MKKDFGVFIKHGSKDSIDEDYFLVVKESSEMSNKDLMILKKEVKEAYPDFDVNIIDINEFGCVTFAMSGTPDEVNNGIISTFHLHEQKFVKENPVKIKVERHNELKWIRIIRGILTHCSHTQYRSVVKQAIKSSDIFEKIQALSGIAFDEIDPNDLKTSLENFYKFIAFQVVQYLGLENKTEIYTKKDAIKFIQSGKCFSSVFCAPFSVKQIENTAIKMINREIKDINSSHVNHILAHLEKFPTNLHLVKIIVDGKEMPVFNTVFGYLSVKSEEYF